VTEILSAHRIGFKHSVAGKNLPELIKITKNLGKYGVIVFEDYNSYLNMDQWNRDLLDKYCLSYNVRAYHMFSRILYLQIYEFFLQNIICLLFYEVELFY
jgi:hypothetical protein